MLKKNNKKLTTEEFKYIYNSNTNVKNKNCTVMKQKKEKNMTEFIYLIHLH